MAAVTLLAQALRGTFVSPNLTIPSGSPAHIQAVVTGAAFPADPTLTLSILGERSFDGGATWENWFGGGGFQGGQAGLPVGKGGAISDGIPRQSVQFDGNACLARVTITVSAPFVWGLTGEVLAT